MAALRDEAATLQSPNDSFASLWTALKERFEIKRLIADNHISEIFQLKPIRHESASDLRNLLDVVMKNLRVLNTIGLPLDDLSEAMLINLLCNRLDADTRKAYELLLSVCFCGCAKKFNTIIHNGHLFLSKNMLAL
jgi:hypothetical protein